jgi:hypothetical protein
VRHFDITVHPQTNEDPIRAEFPGPTDGQGGTNPELPGLIGAGRYDAAAESLFGICADDHGATAEALVIELLDGSVEGVHVDVKDDPVRPLVLVHRGTHYSEMGPNLSLSRLKLVRTVG